MWEDKISSEKENLKLLYIERKDSHLIKKAISAYLVGSK